jgi:flavin reductase (DIM6/NTAB) family NADH-FMN oxidoreductase RutF
MSTTADMPVPAKDIVASPERLDAPDHVLSADDFKLAFRGLAAGVAVITAQVGEEKAAMTATSVASLSATPPLFVFSASQLSSATDVIGRADTVVVHLLSAEQLELAQLCATSGIDRFGNVDQWTTLPSGEPYFLAAQVWIRGRVVNRFTAGSSVVHIVEALSSNVSGMSANDWDGAEPLVYHNRAWHALGDGSHIA